MARTTEVNGTVWIKFRVSRQIYDILKTGAKSIGVSLSEFVRGIIYYYMTQTLLETIKNENPKTLRELREELKKVFLNEK